MRNNVRTHDRSGFTLIELLVVIAIIGVLIALLLPAVQSARVSAMRAQASNDLHQLAIACHDYQGRCGYLPPAAGYEARPTIDIIVGPGGSNSDNVSGSWTFRLLPFVEQNNLYDNAYGDIVNLSNSYYKYSATWYYGDPSIDSSESYESSYTGTHEYYKGTYVSAGYGYEYGGETVYDGPSYTRTNYWRYTAPDDLMIYNYDSVEEYRVDTQTNTYTYRYSITYPNDPSLDYSTTDSGPWYPYGPSGKGYMAARVGGVVPTYLNPLDPSVDSSVLAPASYQGNGNVLTDGMTLEKILDGTSNTMLILEGYTRCSSVYRNTSDFPGYYKTDSNFRTDYSRIWNYDNYAYTTNSTGTYRYDYSNGNYAWGITTENYSSQESYAPVVYPYGYYDPMTGALRAYQHRPRFDTCDVNGPQSSSAAGLLVVMADGSVHTIAPTVTQPTFAALGTPNFGDRVGADWTP